MVKNWRDVLGVMGLGTPVARGFVAGVAATAVCYAASYPQEAFREDGTIKPFSPLSPGPDGVRSKHFLVVPLVVATATFLFT